MCLVYSLQDNAIETKNIGGGPHANYDPGPFLSLGGPALIYVYIFCRNEDRVWRFRGGRDGYETLEQFMSFLGKGSQARGNCFPGIVVYIRGDAKRPYSAGRPFEVRLYLLVHLFVLS